MGRTAILLVYTYASGLIIFGVNCSFVCVNSIMVQLLSIGAAKSPTCTSPFDIRRFCCSVIIS